VHPPGSANPNFIVQRDNLLQRIHRRYDRVLAEETSQDRRQDRSDDKWYKKPVGIIILGVVVGIVLTLIKFFAGL
jgi:maltodextrin utilization protein YvdJ